MYLSGEDRHIEGAEAAVVFVMFFCLGIINMFLRAATGTFAACLVIVPLAIFCPSWELTPWIRQHSFTLLVGVFVLQLILPAATKNGGIQLKNSKFGLER